MARRVNTKFLIILTCVVIGCVVAAVVLQFVLVRKRPQEFIDAANAQIAQKNYAEAAKNLSQARALNPKDPALHVQLGDVLEQLASQDFDQFGKDRQAWERALEADPRHLPALQRLLKYHVEMMRLGENNPNQGAEPYTTVKMLADRILAIDPEDKAARTYSVLAPVLAELKGVQTDREAAQKAIEALREMAAADTGNAELQFAVARVHISRAQELIRFRQVNEARDELLKAIAIFDAPLREHPDHAELNYRAASLYPVLASIEPDTEQRKQHLDKAQQMLAKAAKLANPEDKQYAEIQVAYALALRRGNERELAEKALRDAYAKRSEDPAIRLELAKFLSQTGNRSDAIDILSQPPSANTKMTGPRLMLLRSFQLRTLAELINIRIDEYSATSDSAAKETSLGQIKEGYDQLLQMSGESAESLHMKGKLELAQGKAIEAVQSLERAQSMRGATARGTEDYELMYLLARAYLGAQQTGQAKAMLSEIVDKFENFAPARLQLIQLLIRENAMAEASRHISELEKHLPPNNPEIQRLKLAVMDPVKRGEELKKFYATMPETERQERVNKAQIAVATGQVEEATRLLEKVRQDNPQDLDATQALAQIYLQLKQPEKARSLLEDALKHNPEHDGIKTVLKQLDADSPEERQELVEEHIRNIPDEFTRESKFAELMRARGDRAAALEHLKKAETLKPEDGEVLDGLFQNYFETQDWANAQIYADKLAAINKDKADGALYRFRLAMAKGELRQATDIARSLTEKMPGFSRSWYSLGQALQASGEVEEALSKYIVAIEKQSENADAFRGVIECYYGLQRPDDAKRYIDQARRIFPNNADFAEMEFNHELTHGDPTKVIPVRQAALEKNREVAANWLNLGLAYLRSATMKMAQNEQAAARDFATQARSTFEQALEKWPDERLFYGYLADVALFFNEPQKAEDALQRLAARPSWANQPQPTLMLAELYARMGKIDQAEKVLSDFFAKTPDLDIQQRLATLLSQQRKIDEALKVLEANPDHPRVQRLRVDVLMNSGRFEEAERAMLAMLEKAPQDPILLTHLASAYLNNGRYDEALNRLNDVLSRDSMNSRALYLRGLVKLRRNDLEGAVADLTTARDQQPTNPDFRVALAEAFSNRNDPESAIRELQTAVRMVPQNKALRLHLLQLYATSQPPRWADAERLFREAEADPRFNRDPDWLKAEALSLINRNEPAKAVEKITQAVQLAPDDMNLANAYLNVLYQAKSYQKVIDEADKALAKHNGAWWASQMRALAQKQLGNRDEALASFESALSSAIAANNADAINTVIRGIALEIGIDDALQRVLPKAETDNRWRMIAIELYQRKGDANSALAMVERILADEANLTPPQKQHALRMLGTLHLSATPADPEKAYQAYLRLLETSPDDLIALNNVACVLAEQVNPPRPRQALEYSGRAYDVSQKRGELNPLILDTHGWILVLSDRVDEGINLLRQVVEKAPFVEAHYHLAEAYIRKGYVQDAQAQLKLANDKLAAAGDNPANAVIKQRIEAADAKLREMLQAKTP